MERESAGSDHLTSEEPQSIHMAEMRVCYGHGIDRTCSISAIFLTVAIISEWIRAAAFPQINLLAETSRRLNEVLGSISAGDTQRHWHSTTERIISSPLAAWTVTSRLRQATILGRSKQGDGDGISPTAFRRTARFI
mmetsp:Transcript_27654/g.64849  ORF Transcript_27654/g.64849 Transcript_27654/m.64849 type:complete len:137 (-) Transcript_27654:169-579(-)